MFVFKKINLRRSCLESNNLNESLLLLWKLNGSQEWTLIPDHFLWQCVFNGKNMIEETKQKQQRFKPKSETKIKTVKN